MTKIDIFSGFLGAGKTTLIKKLIQDGYAGQKLVLIENEFGEIGVDAGFLQEAGIEITEMNSGCICCSLVGDFGKALRQVIDQYSPDRILIEPSGVGKLSDVVAAVKKVTSDTVQLGCSVTVADATKCKMYMKNFGEFYNNQIETAGTILLSRTGDIAPEKLDQAVALIRAKNNRATIVTTPWDQLTGAQIVETMEAQGGLAAELAELVHEEEHHHHHHHDHDSDHEEHHHEHNHDHDSDHEEHHHEHHRDHEEHHHDHDGHDQHHHADEVFASWGVETHRKFTPEAISRILKALEDEEKYGIVLRAKGYVAGEDGNWVHFDFVPGEPDIRSGSAAPTGRLCVIGSKLNERAIAELFGAQEARA